MKVKNKERFLEELEELFKSNPDYFVGENEVTKTTHFIPFGAHYESKQTRDKMIMLISEYGEIIFINKIQFQGYMKFVEEIIQRNEE